MSYSSRRTRSSNRHLNEPPEPRSSPRSQGRSSARRSSPPPLNLPPERRSSTRRQTNSSTDRESRSSARQLILPREGRSRRAHILRENRAARDRSRGEPDVNLVQQHFNRMRNRPQRLPSNDPMSDEENSDSGESPHGIKEFNSASTSFPSTPSPHGNKEFNSASTSFPSTPYTFQYPDLHDEHNYVCPHCNSRLWKEERKHRLNCCNNGKYTLPALHPVPPELMNKFRSREFQRAQRAYNGLFRFTALGAGRY